ncbi:MAG: hypothetical protein K6B75_06005 [Lachnospiraceae bacterium]|nr:hypothetical protein [Lachnospiraceae bacterium]
MFKCLERDLYRNIGRMIKSLAFWLFIVQSVAVIGWVILYLMKAGSIYVATQIYVLKGVFILIVGPIISWVISLILYGFGELVDNSSKISVNTNGERIYDYEKIEKEREREDRLKMLLDDKLISIEEYNALLNKSYKGDAEDGE